MVRLCPINQPSGTFGTCVDAGADGSFNAPYGITLDKDNTHAYVVNAGGTTVAVCSIQVNGTFGTCQLTDNLPFGRGVTLNTSNTFAYISLVGGTVAQCAISPIDGSLSACVTTAGYSQPHGIAFTG